ncbi:hypothetical protein J4458_00920 [Candidatus Woesearchaeota archaeon]|nr:hypothetical protein [Candidatus Woesearchaeota archaeon]
MSPKESSVSGLVKTVDTMLRNNPKFLRVNVDVERRSYYMVCISAEDGVSRNGGNFSKKAQVNWTVAHKIAKIRPEGYKGSGVMKASDSVFYIEYNKVV